MITSIQDSPDTSWGASELLRLQDQFPEFDIWAERKNEFVIFVARRQRGSLHPHTLVTANPDEMRMQLAKNSRKAKSALMETCIANPTALSTELKLPAWGGL